MKQSLPTPVVVAIVAIAVIACGLLLWKFADGGGGNVDTQSITKEMNKDVPKDLEKVSEAEAQKDMMMMGGGKKGGG